MASFTQVDQDTGGNSPNATGRACGTCTLCCKVLGVKQIDKPAGKWCPHCAPGKGCLVYATRPEECRTYVCGWLKWPELGPEWKPERSKVILSLNRDVEGAGTRLTASVDPSYPSAWRASPIYQKLKQWAFEGGPTPSRPVRMLVMVKCAARVFVILPNQDIDVGLMADDEVIMTSEKVTPRGVTLEVRKVKRGHAKYMDGA
jgi:hypothetical protein